MKQVVQNFNNGKILLIDVPLPAARSNSVIVRNTISVVSAGTERQMMEFAQKSLLGKAMARPDLVRKVVAVAQTEGVGEAFRTATSRLDTPIPMGYSSAGEVTTAGENTTGFNAGDRVACSGSGFACHAEYVAVPQTLCAPIPDGVPEEEAAFVALGAIALHSLRLAKLQLGDRVVIIGLGLLGLLAVQIAKAWGCQVLGVDVAPNKADIARQLGADSAVAGNKDLVIAAGKAFFGTQGADAVIIFASTRSNEPLELATDLARVRGRIVVPGLVSLEVPRRAFYEKELDLKVSRAWGPGLYDPDYEERGRDYPLPFVRWTAGRNMEAFLQLLAQGSVQVKPLITHRFPIERATEAYQLISEGKEPYIGVILDYGKSLSVNRYTEEPRKIFLKKEERVSSQPITNNRSRSPVRVGVIGAGNFAKATLLPTIRRPKDIHLRGIATATGISGRHTGDKFGFNYCTTDYHELVNDPEINTIFITTRHNTHAQFVIEALNSGKNVFVEKPLCIKVEELEKIIKTYNESRLTNNLVLMVGFNRRFSPFTVSLKEWLSFTNLPMVINIRVNAGFVPSDRWEQDLEVGGGRILGEVCHFVDLIQYLTGAHPVQVYTQAIKPAGQYLSEDNLIITLKMSDGSAGSITYTASGDKAFPRERVEIFRGGAVGLIDNFKVARFTYHGRTRRKRNLFGVDRGYRAEMDTFFSAIHNGDPLPVAFLDYVWTTLTTFSISESIRRGEPVGIELPVSFVEGSQYGGEGKR